MRSASPARRPARRLPSTARPKPRRAGARSRRCCRARRPLAAVDRQSRAAAAGIPARGAPRAGAAGRAAARARPHRLPRSRRGSRSRSRRTRSGCAAAPGRRRDSRRSPAARVTIRAAMDAPAHIQYAAWTCAAACWSDSAERMFDLIEAAEHYPEFLPWCARARRSSSATDAIVVADIDGRRPRRALRDSARATRSGARSGWRSSSSAARFAVSTASGS